MVLILGTGSFILALVMHILIWRVIKPVKHLIWLAIIFVILPLIAYAIVFYLSFLFYKERFIASAPNVGFIVLWHIALSGTYIMTYPVSQAKCPSFKIMLAVSASMPKGITALDINDIFSKDILLTDRVDDLIDEGFIYIKDNKYNLTFKGNLLASSFIFYRHLLSLPLGEG